jgi:hypothetical protein
VNVSVELFGIIGGAVFGAGGAITLLRLMKRDLNGLGANQRKLDSEVRVLLMAVCPDKDRKWLAGVLLGK